MVINLQPTLENARVTLLPLEQTDFEALFAIASDPAVWEQHPNKDRWKREVFQAFFDGALQSRGAFKIIEKATGEVIGSTRFYDHDAGTASIFIGYTFYAKRYWGTGINPSVKNLMFRYLSKCVSIVYFHIGARNLRSQIAITRLGAIKVGEEKVAPYRDEPHLHFLYKIYLRKT